MRNSIRVMMIGWIVVLLLGCGSLPVAAEVGLGIKGGMLIPDRDPFKDDYDSDIVFGGVLEFDSNMGLTLEADVEYFQQDGNAGGDMTLFPFVLMAKYNLSPRYRTTPFVGIGVGAYFFDCDFGDGHRKAKTRYGTRVAGGLRFLEDRRMNLVLEAARNFVDFSNLNASSFEITFSLIFDLYSSEIGTP